MHVCKLTNLKCESLIKLRAIIAVFYCAAADDRRMQSVTRMAFDNDIGKTDVKLNYVKK